MGASLLNTFASLKCLKIASVIYKSLLLSPIFFIYSSLPGVPRSLVPGYNLGCILLIYQTIRNIKDYYRGQKLMLHSIEPLATIKLHL